MSWNFTTNIPRNQTNTNVATNKIETTEIITASLTVLRKARFMSDIEVIGNIYLSGEVLGLSIPSFSNISTMSVQHWDAISGLTYSLSNNISLQNYRQQQNTLMSQQHWFAIQQISGNVNTLTINNNNNSNLIQQLSTTTNSMSQQHWSYMNQLSNQHNNRLSSLEHIIERTGPDVHIGDNIEGDIYIGTGTTGTSTQNIYLGGIGDTVIIGGNTVEISATTLAVSDRWITVNTGGLAPLSCGIRVELNGISNAATWDLDNAGRWRAKNSDGTVINLYDLKNDNLQMSQQHWNAIQNTATNLYNFQGDVANMSDQHWTALQFTNNNFINFQGDVAYMSNLHWNAIQNNNSGLLSQLQQISGTVFNNSL